ncbi:hypothetical protein, partial [Pseudacidovorax sp. RU35E]|uniref:hypothetical protein n=1 Tax=Pseudacidovorax sp. RU35E TaxID=1907403 RepID=UPI001F403866
MAVISFMISLLLDGPGAADPGVPHPPFGWLARPQKVLVSVAMKRALLGDSLYVKVPAGST